MSHCWKRGTEHETTSAGSDNVCTHFYCIKRLETPSTSYSSTLLPMFTPSNPTPLISVTYISLRKHRAASHLGANINIYKCVRAREKRLTFLFRTFSSRLKSFRSVSDPHTGSTLLLRFLVIQEDYSTAYWLLALYTVLPVFITSSVDFHLLTIWCNFVHHDN